MAGSDSGSCGNAEKLNSTQSSDRLREKVRANPIVHVYVARFPFPVEEETVFPSARAEEIARCSNADVRREKYFVWKLLESALAGSFGLKIQALDIKRAENGKWGCSACCFSLSHSGNFVAVAVSEKPVGVDIEKIDEAHFTDALAEKITTVREREEYRSAAAPVAMLNALWTKKEAVFKLLGGKAFLPKNIEVSEYGTVTKMIQSDDGRYFVTVASENAAQTDFRSMGGLEFADFGFQ